MHAGVIKRCNAGRNTTCGAVDLGLLPLYLIGAEPSGVIETRAGSVKRARVWQPNKHAGVPEKICSFAVRLGNAGLMAVKGRRRLQVPFQLDFNRRLDQ